MNRLILCLLLLVTLSACRKTVIIEKEVQVKPEPVISGVFEVLPEQWLPQGELSTSFSHYQKVPALTRERLSNSAVLVYTIDNKPGGFLEPLPYNVPSIVDIYVLFHPGLIEIEEFHPYPIRASSARKFKYFIIPAGKADSLKGTGVSLKKYFQTDHIL